MINAYDLCADFAQALQEKWGYIWSRAGQVWTQAAQDAATRSMTVKYGQRWVGRRVADCSGLFVWAYKQHGEDIYHGSNTIWNEYTDTAHRGAVAGDLSIRPGTAVFMVKAGRRTHIGLYVGGGKVIEAKGTQSGVVESDLSRWDEWAELTDVSYDGVPYDTIEVGMPVLRKGTTGSAVVTLQESLNELGRYGVLELDGVFGAETQSAVRAFQHDHGLTPDGIVGPLTWAALAATIEDDEPEGDVPQDAGNDGVQAPAPSAGMTVEQRLARLEAAVFGEKGGASDG